MTELTLRRMRTEDLAEGLRLTQAESWAYRIEDWEFHFRLGRGWVACDAHGRVLGTAIWWPYGEWLATVGLVVVGRDQQGKGIGRKLMEAVMSDAGSRTLQLVATQAGMKLYLQCGFRERAGIIQQQGVAVAVPLPDDARRTSLREITGDDLETICPWDAAAFGTDRHRVLATVLATGEGFLAERDGRLAGYALARPAGRGTTIGPVVAEDETLAIELVARALEEAGGFCRLDVPEDAARLSAWLETAGLAPVARAAVMTRGVPMHPRGGARVYGLVSQALT
jgi:GNAT superfamily N-acetyltransferase